MIILAFGATGYWLEGTVAAIGGGLSSAYLVRSSFGRIDTDQLNLGLMYLMFGLVMLSADPKQLSVTFIWAVAAGATAKIFLAWYGKARIDLDGDCFLCLAACRAAQGFENRHSAYCCLCFAPVSLPNPFASAYVQTILQVATFCFRTHLKPSRKSPAFPFPTFWSAPPVLWKWDCMPYWPWDCGQSATR